MHDSRDSTIDLLTVASNGIDTYIEDFKKHSSFARFFSSTFSEKTLARMKYYNFLLNSNYYDDRIKYLILYALIKNDDGKILIRYCDIALPTLHAKLKIDFPYVGNLDEVADEIALMVGKNYIPHDYFSKLLKKIDKKQIVLFNAEFETQAIHYASKKLNLQQAVYLAKYNYDSASLIDNIQHLLNHGFEIHLVIRHHGACYIFNAEGVYNSNLARVFSGYKALTYLAIVGEHQYEAEFKTNIWKSHPDVSSFQVDHIDTLTFKPTIFNQPSLPKAIHIDLTAAYPSANAFMHHIQKLESQAYLSSKQRKLITQLDHAWNGSTLPYAERTRMLLNKFYTYNNSRWSRFITLHWNRHHLDEVSSILKNKTLETTVDVLTALQAIRLQNTHGDLATIIYFLEQTFQDNVPQKKNATSVKL